MASRTTRIEKIKKELLEHLPSTILGVISGISILTLFHQTAAGRPDINLEELFEKVFHFFHSSHIFLSAITATAIFYRHEKNRIKTFLVVFVVTLIFCGTSDALIPFAGAFIFGAKPHLHLCLIEDPALILTANALGILAGFISEAKFKKISYFSHGAHVFVASFASLSYLVSFGAVGQFQTGLMIAGLFVIATVAVVIPCCSGDIIMPLSFIGGLHGHEHEDEHTHDH